MKLSRISKWFKNMKLSQARIFEGVISSLLNSFCSSIYCNLFKINVCRKVSRICWKDISLQLILFPYLIKQKVCDGVYFQLSFLGSFTWFLFLQHHYVVNQISLISRCDCNGHGDGTTCPLNKLTGSRTCVCHDNTCGAHCEICCPAYNQYPWKKGSSTRWISDNTTACEGNTTFFSIYVVSFACRILFREQQELWNTHGLWVVSFWEWLYVIFIFRAILIFQHATVTTTAMSADTMKISQKRNWVWTSTESMLEEVFVWIAK